MCQGDDEIERIFDDHETIAALGLHSSINIPVVEGEQCVGVLNFLMAGVRVTTEQVDAARDVAKRADVIATLRDAFG